jgi:hypothetical protein
VEEVVWPGGRPQVPVRTPLPVWARAKDAKKSKRRSFIRDLTEVPQRQKPLVSLG